MIKDVNTLIKKAREGLTKLTGLKASSVIKAGKNDNEWRISIEMIEKKSIPDQMDILAIYEAHLDEEGNLLDFERKSMRKRMDVVEKM